MTRTFILAIALLIAGAALGCTTGDDDLCNAARGITAAHYDQMATDEATGARLWFWVDAPYASQQPQKGALFVDSSTGFMLASADDGAYSNGTYSGNGIGAWISVEYHDAIREGYDRYACTVTGPSMPRQLMHCPGLARDREAALDMARTCALAEARAAYKARAKGATATCEFFGKGWYKTILRVDSDGIPYQAGVEYPWPAGAGKRPLYDTAEEGARIKFNVLAQRAGRPVPQRVITARPAAEKAATWARLNSGACPKDTRSDAAPRPPSASGGDQPPDPRDEQPPPPAAPPGGDF